MNHAVETVSRENICELPYMENSGIVDDIY